MRTDLGLMTDDDGALRTWAQFELECLWSDLREAHHRRGYEVWTVGCESLGDRIIALTAIIGPISWRRVGMSGIADGWFNRVNEILAITDPDLPDEAGVAYAQMWVQRQIDSVR